MTPKSNGIELLNPNYVPIIKDTTKSYGGNQMWFSANNKLSEDYVLHQYGCGTIATADLFLYWAIQNEDYRNPVTDTALKESDTILYSDYDRYVRNINKDYTNTHRVIAVLGPKAASAINSYALYYKVGYKASWKLKLSYYDMYDMMEEMLQNDIPVILAIGPNTPNLWGKKGIKFYQRNEITNPGPDEEKNKPYYYKAVKQDISGHYVTVTGLIKDDIAGTIMLKISSWGKQYYINYEEYRDYLENAGGTITSSIIYIRRKR